MTKRSLLASLISIVTIGLVGVLLTLITSARPALGLDLEGGASVVLQPVDANVDQERLSVAAQIIRDRVDAIGVAEPDVRTQGNTIVVELPGVKDTNAALAIVGQTGELLFRPVLGVFPGKDAVTPEVPSTTSGAPTSAGASTTAGPSTSAGATTSAGASTTAGATTVAPPTSAAATSVASPTSVAPTTVSAPAQSAAPGRSRRFRTQVTTVPTTVATPTTAAATTLAASPTTVGVTTAPGSTAPVSTVAGSATTLAGGPTTTLAGGPTTTLAGGPTTTLPPVSNPVNIFDSDGLIAITDRKLDIATAEVILPEFENGKEVRRYRLGPAGLPGTAVSDAKIGIGNDGEATVDVVLKDNAETRSAFQVLSDQCFNGAPTCPGTVGRGSVAVVVDGRVISAPTWNLDSQPADNRIQISGSFTDSEAKSLAKLLRFGALPVKLETQAVQTVSATLGKDSLRAGLIAGAIGIGLVIALMCLYYRALGLVVLAGLMVSGSLMWTLIAWLGETRGLALTLAGATGIIVSIGVTVDSYVVYFERLKDDVRLGRSLRTSAERGFKSAYRTIIAADLVSLLAAGLLWWLTVGSVRGFAFFLGISTMLDMVVAYWFTRPLVILLSRTKRFASLKVLGVMTGESAVAGSQELDAGDFKKPVVVKAVKGAQV
jgi:preprotein translocase subunit SecD